MVNITPGFVEAGNKGDVVSALRMLNDWSSGRRDIKTTKHRWKVHSTYLCAEWWAANHTGKANRSDESGVQTRLVVCQRTSLLEVTDRNEEAAEVCLSGKLYSITCVPQGLLNLLCGVDWTQVRDTPCTIAFTWGLGRALHWKTATSESWSVGSGITEYPRLPGLNNRNGFLPF